jgi:glycosyltransferase involved in cell wall biosynthesis
MARRLLFILNEALFFTTHRMPIGLAMRDAGWDVHVAAPDWAPFRAKIEAAGMTFHPIPLDRGARHVWGEVKLVGALWALVRDLKPDLVHHVAMKPVLWGGMVSRLLGVPAAVHAITGLGFVFIRGGAAMVALRAVLKRLYRFALHHKNNVAIFQNVEDRGLFERERLVPPDRIVMIAGCGVNLVEFAATPEPPGPPVVMFPARLLGDKGINEFIGAVEILKREGSAARFVLVGRRDPLNPTDVGETKLNQWVRSGLVEYWGYSDSMPATLAQAHIVVMPSYREGLPRGLIEAAACGRAIVTTDVPGCRAVVRHEDNGLLVPLQDVPATAAAIRRLLDDAGLRHRLAARGRAIAEAEYSVEAFVADSLAAYRRVLPPGALP